MGTRLPILDCSRGMNEEIAHDNIAFLCVQAANRKKKIETFGYMGQVGQEIAQTFVPLATVPISNMTMFPLFDQLSLIRSFGSFIMDLFDGTTDIFAAAQILAGHHSFRGDVPAMMLAYGTPGEVSEYCERLITEIGMKTPGFMLGTDCEVPLNCKPENYAALMQSLPRYAR